MHGFLATPSRLGSMRSLSNEPRNSIQNTLTLGNREKQLEKGSKILAGYSSVPGVDSIGLSPCFPWEGLTRLLSGSYGAEGGFLCCRSPLTRTTLTAGTAKKRPTMNI